MTTLISVKDLRVSFAWSKTLTTEAVKSVSFDIPTNSTVGTGGRVRQRQERDGHGHRAPAARRTPSSTPPARSSLRGKTLLTAPMDAMRAHTRQRHLCGVPRPYELAQPGFHRWRANRRGAAHPLESKTPPGTRPCAGADDRGRASPTQGAAQRLPAPACRAASSNA